MIGDPSFVEGRLLRIFVGEDAHWRGQPLYCAIVQTLKDRGVAGASVFRGVEGFGDHQTINRSRLFAFGTKMPIVVEAVDLDDRIDALIPELEPMLEPAGGVITVERIEYRRYLPKPR